MSPKYSCGSKAPGEQPRSVSPRAHRLAHGEVEQVGHGVARRVEHEATEVVALPEGLVLDVVALGEVQVVANREYTMSSAWVCSVILASLLREWSYSRSKICTTDKSTARVRLTGTRVFKKHQKGAPDSSGAPRESHNNVAVLLPLNQESVGAAARGGSRYALVSMLPTVVLTIPSADVKATSRAPFAHP